mgnify:CR=1 FL=1
MYYVCFFFFFQAEDGIRDLVRSRGLGDVYKRQFQSVSLAWRHIFLPRMDELYSCIRGNINGKIDNFCLLYTSDAADERSSVDLGGRRILKKKNNIHDILGRDRTRKQ